MTIRPHHVGLVDRCRNEDGTIRHKNGSAHIGTLRGIYGHDFAAGRRPDMKLDTLLHESGAPSLSQYLKKQR
jgi:hypothetical protein